MFDLTTQPVVENDVKKHFAGVYINKSGMIDTFHFELDGSYYHDEREKFEYDAVISEYKNKFILFRNYSKYNSLTENVIDTDYFRIESNNDIIRSITPFENIWGDGIKNCLELSLKNEIYSNVFAAGRSVPEMNTRLIPYLCPEYSLPLRLVIMTDRGLKLINGYVKYEFREDRTETCPTCIQGFVTFEESILKVGKHIIAGTQHASFTGNFIHDFDCSNDMAITRSLYDAFRPVIELAKIKNINFVEIK